MNQKSNTSALSKDIEKNILNRLETPSKPSKEDHHTSIDDKRDHLYMVFGKRTNRKAKETFILNALWQMIHWAGIDDIEPVTQYFLPRTDESGKKFALQDLYFPAVRVAVECNEGFHQNPNNQKQDQERQKDISRVHASSVLFAKTNMPGYKNFVIDAEAPLQVIYQQLSDVVKEIIERRAHLIKTEQFSGWKNSADRKSDLKIKASNDIRFRIIRDICHFFDKDFKTNQRGYYIFENTHFSIWAAQLDKGLFDSDPITISFDHKTETLTSISLEEAVRQPSNKKWKNYIQIKGDDHYLIEVGENAPKKTDDFRITFVQLQDNKYHFLGVYKYRDCLRKPQQDDANPVYVNQYQRVADSITWALNADGEIDLNSLEAKNT